MIKELVQWYRGYIWVELKGINKERFVNLCRNREILLWDVRVEECNCYCKISLEGYWKTKKIARKTHVRPVIQKKYGFPFWFERVKKRKGMIVGFVSGLACVYFLSIHVWNISFVGQSLYTEERLLSFLAQDNVYVGMLTSKVNCQRIEEQIRLAYPDIGWVSAELRGTKLIVSMVETNMPVAVVKKEGGYHLIASHDGVVRKMITRSGTPIVAVGDSVKKGDVLISGILEYRDDAQTIVKREKVCADGDIWIETQYKYYDSCKKRYNKKIYTGYEKKIFGLEIGNRKIFFSNPFKTLNNTRKYDIIASVQQVSFSKSFVLPFAYRRKCYREYEMKMEDYTRKEAKESLNKKFLNYLEKIQKNGIKVLEHNVTFKVDKDSYEAEGMIKVIEKVTEYRMVQDDEWRVEEEDEFDRDSG